MKRKPKKAQFIPAVSLHKAEWVPRKMTPARQARLQKVCDEMCAMCPTRIARAWAWWHMCKLDPKMKKPEGVALCEYMEGLVERFTYMLPVVAWGWAETAVTLMVLHRVLRLKFECEAANRIHLSPDELRAAEAEALRMYEKYWEDCCERGERP